MKRIHWMILASMLLSGCAPTATPAPTALLPTAPAAPTDIPATATAELAPAALAGPQAGSSMLWVDGSMLVYVPAGEFTMGSGAGDAPLSTVYLDGYWISATVVTNKMYSQCVLTGNCAAPAQEVGSPVYSNPLYGDFPVVGVTWDMADNYCGWAEAQLPTEAQWEKAARGSEASPFPWGTADPECSLLNSKGCVGHTNSVLDFPGGRSQYGAYDMAGNVFQWVNDIYNETAYAAMDPRNPTGPASGDSHVLRGSSYETELALLPSATRHFGGSGYHSGELGFRCAVAQPRVIAPYCQLSSYVPTGKGPTEGSCELPQLGTQRNYCAGRVGYATITIPDGADYSMQASGFTCSDAVVDGQRVVTCSGPDLSTGKLNICNPACGGAPSESGAPVVCDPGYSLDASKTACVYSPIPLEADVAGCPNGYNLIERGERKICAPGLSQNGNCPPGTYFDGQYGACVSPGGGTEAPYGIDDPDAAAQVFQGCAAGYTYDPGYQCCQANAGGAYPGCPLGAAFDSAQNTCVPYQISVSAPGCVTVSMNIARCQELPEDVCGAIGDETSCKRNSQCAWDDRRGLCRQR